MYSTLPEQQTQAGQIWQALVSGLEKGFIKESLISNALTLSNPDLEFTPEQQWEALDILTKSRARGKLSKLGITYPTKKDFEHPIKVINLSDGLWSVETTTKGSKYTVKRDGFALKCSCPSPDFSGGFVNPGWCKHIEAVEDSEVERPSLKIVDQSVSSTPLTAPSVEPIKTPSFEGTKSYPFPSGFTPTGDQQKAWDGLNKGLDILAPMMLLQGGAGTGKTTLITELFQRIQSEPCPPPTCAIAPTNQAKDVLKDMLRSKNIRADVMTAAQLLGMRMNQDGDFNRDYSYEHPIDKYSLILADECSSYGQKYWQHFQAESFKGKRFLFMGDEAQLWEVNGGEPPAFTETPDEWQFNLYEVKRYDGAILAAALDFRAAITQRSLPVVNPDKSQGLYVMGDKTAWLQSVVKAVKKAESSTDYVAIAYRNARVREINQAAHLYIHGSNAERFYEGQTVIADAPHMDSGATTSQRITIERLQKGSVNGYDCHFISFWSENGYSTAPVLTQDALVDFEKQCKAYSQQGQGWRSRKLRSQFLWVSYSHAITAHKAQGSTLGTIFLDLKDIARCSTKRKRRRDGALIYEAPQLGYVGLTRASKKAVVLQ